MKTTIDSLLHGKISNFMKIHEILKKHPERYSITVKNLICSTNTPNGGKLSLEKGLFYENL